MSSHPLTGLVWPATPGTTVGSSGPAPGGVLTLSVAPPAGDPHQLQLVRCRPSSAVHHHLTSHHQNHHHQQQQQQHRILTTSVILSDPAQPPAATSHPRALKLSPAVNYNNNSVHGDTAAPPSVVVPPCYRHILQDHNYGAPPPRSPSPPLITPLISPTPTLAKTQPATVLVTNPLRSTPLLHHHAPARVHVTKRHVTLPPPPLPTPPPPPPSVQLVGEAAAAAARSSVIVGRAARGLCHRGGSPLFGPEHSSIVSVRSDSSTDSADEGEPPDQQQQQKLDVPLSPQLVRQPTDEKQQQGGDDSVTNCICGLQHDDGYMICCDRCSVWQHVDCVGLTRGSIPDIYLCHVCHPRRLDRRRARALQLRKRQRLLGLSKRGRRLAPGARRPRGGAVSRSARGRKVGARRGGSLAMRRHASIPVAPPADGELPSSASAKSAVSPSSSPSSSSSSSHRHRTCSSSSTSTSSSEADQQEAISGGGSSVDSDPEHQEAITNHYSPELRARLSGLRTGAVPAPPLPGSEPCALRRPEPGASPQLVTNCSVAANTTLFEYRGKCTLADTLKQQQPSVWKQYQPHVLFYRLPRDSLLVSIDARRYGNAARHVQRSCRPNAVVRHVVDKGSLHLYLVASTAIPRHTPVSIAHEQLAPWRSQPPCHVTGGCRLAGGVTAGGTGLEDRLGGKLRQRRHSSPHLVAATNGCAGTGKGVTSPSHSPPLPTTTPLSPHRQHVAVARRSNGSLISSRGKPTPIVRKRSAFHPVINDETSLTTAESDSLDSRSSLPSRRRTRRLTGASQSEEDEDGTEEGPEDVEPGAARRSGPQRRRARSSGGPQPRHPSGDAKKRSPTADRPTAPAGSSSAAAGNTPISDQAPKKLTREERKLEAIVRAFERMEKLQQRQQQTGGGESPRKSSTRSVSCSERADSTEDSATTPSLGNSQNTRKRTLSRRGGGSVSRLSRALSSPQRKQSSADLTDDSHPPPNCLSAPTAGTTSVQGFRFPRTKKVLMSEWLNETVDPVISSPRSDSGHVSITLDHDACLPLEYTRPSPPLLQPRRASHDAQEDAPGGPQQPWSAAGSAKKRWLRQAISEELEPSSADSPAAAVNGCNSPSAHQDAAYCYDLVTPLKKRRVVLDSSPDTHPSMLSPPAMLAASAVVPAMNDNKDCLVHEDDRLKLSFKEHLADDSGILKLSDIFAVGINEAKLSAKEESSANAVNPSVVETSTVATVKLSVSESSTADTVNPSVVETSTVDTDTANLSIVEDYPVDQGDVKRSIVDSKAVSDNRKISSEHCEVPVTTVVESTDSVTTVVKDEIPVTNLVKEEDPVITVVESTDSVTTVVKDEVPETTVVESGDRVTTEVESTDKVPTVVEEENLVTTEVESTDTVSTVVEEETPVTTEVESTDTVPTVVEEETPVTTEVESADSVTTVVNNEDLMTSVVECEDPETTAMDCDPVEYMQPTESGAKAEPLEADSSFHVDSSPEECEPDSSESHRAKRPRFCDELGSDGSRVYRDSSPLHRVFDSTSSQSAELQSLSQSEKTSAQLDGTACSRNDHIDNCDVDDATVNENEEKTVLAEDDVCDHADSEMTSTPGEDETGTVASPDDTTSPTADSPDPQLSPVGDTVVREFSVEPEIPSVSPGPGRSPVCDDPVREVSVESRIPALRRSPVFDAVVREVLVDPGMPAPRQSPVCDTLVREVSEESVTPADSASTRHLTPSLLPSPPDTRSLPADVPLSVSCTADSCTAADVSMTNGVTTAEQCSKPSSRHCSVGEESSPMDLLTASPERLSRLLAVTRHAAESSAAKLDSPAPPQPVKRRLSLQDYRRRKQDPKVAPRQPAPDPAALWPHVPPSTVSEASLDCVTGGMTAPSLTPADSRDVLSVSVPSADNTSQISPSALDVSPSSDPASPPGSPTCPLASSPPPSPLALLSTVRWSDEPTALERQRETLTARLRRDFGIKVAEQGEDESRASLPPPEPRHLSRPPPLTFPPPVLPAAPLIRSNPPPRGSLLLVPPPVMQQSRLSSSSMWRLRSNFPPDSLHALPNGLPTCPPPPPRPRPPLSQLRPLKKPSCPDN